MDTQQALEQRITDLEIKASFAEDTVEQLNQVVVRQQAQIDRLRPGPLAEPAWVAAGQRVQPGCAPEAERFDAVRWPALLGPFLEAEQRHPLERLPWRADCAPREPVANRLRVVGLEPGTVLRPAPGQREVVLKLQAIGAQQGLTWLLDGQWMAASPSAAAAQTLRVDRPGPHRLTVMDGLGRWARVEFQVGM